MYKVCFVTTVSITLKTFVIETAKKLYMEDGVEITFICDYDKEFEELLPEYINYIPISMKRGISISGVSAIFKMFFLFRKEKYDLIQYSTPNASLYASISSFLARTNKRLYCQWGIRYVGMEGVNRKIFRAIEKLTCYLSTDIRSVSRKNMRLAIDEKLFKNDKAKVIGEGGTIGVDLDIFDISKKEEYRKEIRLKYGINKEFVYGFVGRLSNDKGANELLQAFKNISKNIDAKLFIIGSSEIDQHVSEELITWAKTNKNIIFTGYINSKDLVRYYSAFDCYVHPTYREGFGMVLQEAAAMKNAIITTDIPGASEVMENKLSCILVPPKDTKSLEEEMLNLINNKDKVTELGEEALKRVEKYFDRHYMLKQQLMDYQSLMK